MSEQELDQLLDAALPAYLAEPPAGINHRVVARVQARAVARIRRARAWTWAAGLAAAAALAVAAFVSRPAAVDIAPPPLVAHAPAAPSVHFEPRPVRHRRPPTRSLPLTRREYALIQFAQTNPDLARQILVEHPQRLAEPLALTPVAIEPITIEPLASASGGE